MLLYTVLILKFKNEFKKLFTFFQIFVLIASENDNLDGVFQLSNHFSEHKRT